MNMSLSLKRQKNFFFFRNNKYSLFNTINVKNIDFKKMLFNCKEKLFP